MAARNRDLIVVVVIAAVAAGWLPLAGPGPARVVLGLLLACFCPGYALTAALFPGLRPGWPERVLLSLGLSLAVAILGAVALNWSPWRLQTHVWVALFFGVTLLACLGAVVRRRPGQVLRLPARPSLRPGQWGLLVLAAAVTTGALALARTPLPAPNAQGYTLLYLLPYGPADGGHLRLGLQSGELADRSYRLEVTAAGEPLGTWETILLRPGQTWQTFLDVPEQAGSGPVVARLFRLDEPWGVYREVTWWRTPQTSGIDVDAHSAGE